MKNTTVDKLLSAIDPTAFYSRHLESGFTPNGKTKVVVNCPFHEDRNPSLSIDLETGKWFCHGQCQEGGTPIQFWSKLHGTDHETAVGRLCEEYGISSTHGGIKTPAKRTSTFLTVDQVDRLHRQLMDNDHFLSQLMQTRGLAPETLIHYRIGLQNGKPLFVWEIEPGRWTWKEHKGLQAKGNKAALFPGDALKDNPRTVIIAEGEFDALLLNQHGFPAVSGTAGAGTWKSQWNPSFDGLNVILAYDADEAGNRGSLRVAESLAPFARTIKAVTWPPEMNNPHLKDVTDFFVKLGRTRNDFQFLLDRAKEVGPSMVEVEGMRFIQPPGFVVDASGVRAGSTNREGIVTWSSVFHTPVFITARAIDVDSGTEEMELTFRRDQKLKQLWVPRRTISDARKVVELADTGFPVSSENSKQMIRYCTAFEAANLSFIPKRLVARGPGWKDVAGKTLFLLDARSNSASMRKLSEDDNIVVEFVAESGFERFMKALNPQGSFAGWKRAIEPALGYHLAQFALYASFAAPLLRILKAPNFLLDFWGATSTGKTTVLELAASVWGNPHKESGGLVFSWDSTKVFLEQMAHFFCDVPIFPDDSQVVPDNILRNILYMVANGVGRGRGSVFGIRHTPTWHTVCFSTGERPLVDCTTYAGAKARTIEIYGSPFPDCGGSFINTLKQGIRLNYGHAGPKFIEGLSAIVDNPVKTQELKTNYTRYQQAFSDKARSEVGDRYSHYFAVVRVAADLVCKILGIDDDLLAEIAIDEVFRSLIGESTGEMDTSTRAFAFIISWASANEAFFLGNATKDRGTHEAFGLWNEDDSLCIYPHKVEEVLTKEGYSPRATLKAWADKGWIQVNPGRLNCLRRVPTEYDNRYPSNLNSDTRTNEAGGKLRRFVVIPWKTFTSFSER